MIIAHAPIMTDLVANYPITFREILAGRCLSDEHNDGDDNEVDDDDVDDHGVTDVNG